LLRTILNVLDHFCWADVGNACCQDKVKKMAMERSRSRSLRRVSALGENALLQRTGSPPPGRCDATYWVGRLNEKKLRRGPRRIVTVINKL